MSLLIIASTPVPTLGGGPTPNSVSAATGTAQHNALSTLIAPYWTEIGDRNGRIFGMSVSAAGVADVVSSQKLSIASASKMIYATYVRQWRAGAGLTSGPLSDIEFLRMTSGYTTMSAECAGMLTVHACMQQTGYDVQTASDVGKFHYDGDHHEKHADLYTPLKSLGILTLGSTVRAMLNCGTGLSYSQPLMAGGVTASADDIALVLRAILRGDLLMKGVLGTNAVCTKPSAPGCNAVFSPLPTRAWHYSMGHWVEDDASLNNDGAFSSPGAFGFYPWIDATKTYYGIIARKGAAGQGGASADIGQLIRHAFMTGHEQTGSLPT